jgi:hypothetical protein
MQAHFVVQALVYNLFISCLLGMLCTPSLGFCLFAHWVKFSVEWYNKGHNGRGFTESLPAVGVLGPCTFV